MRSAARNVQQTLAMRQTSASPCLRRNANPTEMLRMSRPLCAFQSRLLLGGRHSGSSACQLPCAASSSSISPSAGATTKPAGPSFGIACSMGKREEMEDELCCIPQFGAENSLYAGVKMSQYYDLDIVALPVMWESCALYHLSIAVPGCTKDVCNTCSGFRWAWRQ
jgi:hypothetical protein